MSAARPVTLLPKREVLSALFASWDDIDSLVSPLSEEQWRTASPLPGWTVHCLVSHIIGTESMLLGKETPAADLSGVDHVRNDIGAMNEGWVQQLNGESGAGLLQMFRTVTGRRRAALSALPDDEWTCGRVHPRRTGQLRTLHADPGVRLLDARPRHPSGAGPSAVRRRPGQPGGPNRARRGGRQHGLRRREAGPGARRVAGGHRTDGPVGRTIRVAVDGRAAVVDDFAGADPTTVIRLDAVQFTRLCGGRPMFDALPLDIAFDGDTEVGHRIVENLNYVI